MNQEDVMETEKERKIKGLLNLEKIEVGELDCFSSSSCGAHCYFSIECYGRHGYTEDPRFGGIVFKVLNTKRKGDEVILKIKAKVREEEDD